VAKILTIQREAHFFANRPGLADEVEKLRQLIPLATDQLFHVPVPGDHIVRRGKLRVSQFMPDGREVSRAVLQAGAVMLAREGEEREANPAADCYNVDDLVLMALGDVELWSLPAGAVETAED
jgi:hypothetical protein